MIDTEIMEPGADSATLAKWAPVLEGIEDSYTQRVTAQLLENQAKAIMSERLDEATTTTQSLGTFQKFAFPLVRRVFPELIANKICGVQPMSGPVSQIFYLGSDRTSNLGGTRTIYSKYDLTWGGLETSAIGTLDATGSVPTGSLTLSDMGLDGAGGPSATYGGQIANFPQINTTTQSTWGFSMSAGEVLTGTGIPDMTFHIEQQPVVARTRKMRALWTLEASQDLKAYHNMDLERELTELLSSELRLEIDRELIEDLRMVAYDVTGALSPFNRSNLDWGNSNNFAGIDTGDLGSTSDPNDSNFGDFQNEFTAASNPAGSSTRNIYLMDWNASALNFAPRHAGDVYANLLALINITSQSIYTSTQRGPGNWILCAPVVASMLESSAKLMGGIAREDGPTNMGKNGISYVGKFMGRYDMYVDPLYPEDEILMGYKGASPMDAGYVYAPYIPLQGLPKVVDPNTFQPRKGLITRYGKAAITPESRFYRIIRFAGTGGLLGGWTQTVGSNGGDVSP
jgi:hypothetical protein